MWQHTWYWQAVDEAAEERSVWFKRHTYMWALWTPLPRSQPSTLGNIQLALALDARFEQCILSSLLHEINHSKDAK